MFFFILHHVDGCGRAGTMGRRRGSVMFWAMWESLGPGFHVDVSLTRITFLYIFMAMVFPNSSVLFLSRIILSYTLFREQNNSGMV